MNVLYLLSFWLCCIFRDWLLKLVVMFFGLIIFIFMLICVIFYCRDLEKFFIVYLVEWYKGINGYVIFLLIEEMLINILFLFVLKCGNVCCVILNSFCMFILNCWMMFLWFVDLKVFMSLYLVLLSIILILLNCLIFFLMVFFMVFNFNILSWVISVWLSVLSLVFFLGECMVVIIFYFFVWNNLVVVFLILEFVLVIKMVLFMFV